MLEKAVDSASVGRKAVTQEQVSQSQGRRASSWRVHGGGALQVDIYPEAKGSTWRPAHQASWLLQGPGLLSLGHEEAALTQPCPTSETSWDKMLVMWIDQGLEEDIMEQG